MKPSPLRLYPIPSRILLIYLITLHLSTCLCIILTDLPWLLKGAMLMLCTSSFIHHLHKPKIILLSYSPLVGGEPAPHSLRGAPKGRMRGNEWQLLDEQGNLNTATLCGDSIATQSLLILNFKLKQGAKLSLTLPSDALAPDEYRRLRARLLAT